MRTVVINVRHNDPADVKRGFPSIIGFDFFVDVKENPRELEAFLRNELQKAGYSYLGVGVSRPTVRPTKERLWTRLGMVRAIKKEASWMAA